jgi:hypothetical protein
MSIQGKVYLVCALTLVSAGLLVGQVVSVPPQLEMEEAFSH